MYKESNYFFIQCVSCGEAITPLCHWTNEEGNPWVVEHGQRIDESGCRECGISDGVAILGE